MTRLRKQIRRIIDYAHDQILLAYVICFIKTEELRSKLENMRK